MMEWDNQESLETHQNNNNNNNNSNNNNNNCNQRGDQNGGGVNGAMYVKVMTDEQLETLRKQIAVYATICEQLVEMHKSLSAQQDLAGFFSFSFLGFFYFFC